MANKISKLIERRRLTATHVARRAGVAPSTVTRMMGGQMPTDKTAEKIAGALGVKKSSILG